MLSVVNLNMLILFQILLYTCFVLADFNLTIGDSDPPVKYTGNWKPSKSPLDFKGQHQLGLDPTARAELTFKGKAIHILAPLWDYPVGMQYTLDGGSSGSGVISFQDPSLPMNSTPGGHQTQQFAVRKSIVNLDDTVEHKLEISLPPDFQFVIADGFIVTQAGDPHSTETSPLPQSTTTTPPAAAEQQQQRGASAKHAPSSAVIVGATLGSVVVVLLIAALIIYYRLRRNKHQVVFIEDGQGKPSSSDRPSSSSTTILGYEHYEKPRHMSDTWSLGPEENGYQTVRHLTTVDPTAVADGQSVIAPPLHDSSAGTQPWNTTPFANRHPHAISAFSVSTMDSDRLRSSRLVPQRGVAHND